MTNNKLPLSYYTGCLLGGAVGDALGAPIEFMDIQSIRSEFGERGVTDYVEFADHEGEFTDDTQMTLFTAEGILRARHRAMIKGIGGALISVTHRSYLRWLHTQQLEANSSSTKTGWLIKQKDLFKRREPGNTCLRALSSGMAGSIDKPINNSKGCGGVMRVAPVGLKFKDSGRAFRIGCEMAALTHGHPSGYLSAGCFSSILTSLSQGEQLTAAIDQSINLLKEWPQYEETLYAIEHALDLFSRKPCTPENIEELGGGWVGEEALAITLFCSLHYEQDFRSGVLTAVNHSGDSDSTGSMTGNLLGLINGENAIPQQWIDKLRHSSIVRQVAEDLHIGVKGDSYHVDEEWWYKYPGG